MENIVVGCGLTGSVIARHLAEKDEKVVIWERRNHIGGNMYDYVDDNGICVHKYGPHVFHTFDEKLKDYMMQYGSWVDFPITCRVSMLEKVTPSPFNYRTIDVYYDREEAHNLKKEMEKCFPGRETVTIVEMLGCDDPLVRQYAEFLFDHDYSLYTAKQWGIDPSEIDPSVLKRVPVRLSYKDGYFDDTWQMVPRDGYTEWYNELLDHENIEVVLGMEALLHIKITSDRLYIDGKEFDGKVFYTGPVDELLEMRYGSLPYRSLRFDWQTKQGHFYQETALVAYPEAEGFTRITEYNHFPQKQNVDVSSVAYEYPVAYKEGKKVEPYYPILTEESQRRYRRYRKELSKVKNLVLCGRLADFKYYNMDQALENALQVCGGI